MQSYRCESRASAPIEQHAEEAKHPINVLVLTRTWTKKKNKKIKSKKKIEISRIKMTGWLLRRRRRRCCCCCCIEVGNRCTLPTISLYTRTGQSSWKTIPIFALVSGWHQTIQSISIPFYPICTVYALHEANVSVFIWLRRRNSIKISLNSLFVVVVAYSVFAVELVWAHTV